MSQSKLFDYNSSFSVIRTNPRITGNLRITVDSESKVSFNSMDANQTLSNDRFKNFNITGENPFALDVFNFFDKGKLANNIIFDTARFTRGDREVSKIFSDQYDFFYGSGASALADKNYGESFSYFAPLWIKNEIPDYFVIFRVPGPLSYVYSKNETIIKPGVNYKIVKYYDSDSDFIISYGKTGSGEPIFINSGSVFTGSSEYASYDIVSGSGVVCVFDELYNIDLVDDVSTTFKDKILPNCSVVKTFNLTEKSKIGKYIRNIVSDKNFTNSPIDVNWGPDSYTYYNGVSVAEGIYTKKGEILSGYFSSDASDRMLDFESYMTGGFSRNGIIPPNILNLEFLFDDEDAEMYSINRYFGMYVSRNDINEFRSNGEFYYKFRDLEGNENLPKPTRDSVGYYYSNDSYGITADSGVRLFYEKDISDGTSPGLLPGSDNVNILDSEKLYYITDKNDNFYSLKRDEGYTQFGGNSPKYEYGPYDEVTGTFGTTGSNFVSTKGSLVLHDTKVDLLNFTGITEKISTVPATRATTPGRAYAEIEFLKNYDKSKPLVFKLYWPNGNNKEGTNRYDIISSSDLSAVLVWIDGSYYSTGSSFYFNAATGQNSDIATAFSGVLGEVDSVTWDAGVNLNSTVIRLRDYGEYGNNAYSIGVFDDYEYFVSKFRGEWSSSETYNVSDIVMYMGIYYSAINTVSPSYYPPNDTNVSTSWMVYDTFVNDGYLKINGVDAASLDGPVKFIGGTKKADSRLVFPVEYLDFIKPGDFINTKAGYTKVNSITKYVDSPQIDPISSKITGFENFTYNMVLNIDENIVIDLGYDRSFNVYKSAKMSIGVFSFFDVKEFDFDFWSSDYSYTPTPETYKYFQIPTGVTGVIRENVPYIVKQGQAEYNGVVYPQVSDSVAITSNLFYGVSGATSIKNASPDLFKELVVIPAEYSDIYYSVLPNVIYGGTTGPSQFPIGYNNDLDTFNGFIGIQDLSPDPVSANSSKIEIFNRGKLSTEYEYLNENYNVDVANVSRIVPFINKWGYSDGTDARGNQYRLNSSPAFTPTNFSPSFDKNSSDSRYLTHEWFLLEQPPRDFPISSMQNQNSYLSGKIDLSSAVDTSGDYLASYFTVEPSDYDPEFRDDSTYTKELFTTFTYNKSSGFYETLFRGAKVILKKRSNLSNSLETSLDKYIPKYRNYEDYKFAAILRPVAEDDSSIQEPVKYRIIENQNQRFILFVCDVVMRDYKSLGVGYTGGTGGNPILDYTLLYSINSKEKLRYPPVDGSLLYEISDIKLSAALDLSVGSGSVVNTNTGGKIGIISSSLYDTDLREEVHTFFSQNSSGATSGPSSTGIGSFYVDQFSSLVTYPWPIGVGPDYLDFGKIVPAGTIIDFSPRPEYSFDIPFSTANPVVVPAGPQSIYRNKPVFQKSGGSSYYSSILQRISLSGISERVNSSSKYIMYETYNDSGVISNDFELHMDRPSKIIKSKGSKSDKYYGGPQTLGESVPTAYTVDNDLDLPSTLLRYSGGYEPIFRKILHFDRDKNDSISQYPLFDLSFRNCNFSPDKRYFGISRNLSFTKVSTDKNILSLSQNLPEGPVYPLVGQSPIWIKNFNVFSSSWDPGYYYRFTGPLVYDKVAGTRSMKEYKGFLGSKIMKTPDPLEFDNYITMQVIRGNTNYGTSDVSIINSQINSFVKPVQYIDTTNSGTGIGKSVPYNSGVDYDKLDLGLFPNLELVWQYFSDVNKVRGIIRLDRILSRYLLNDGIKQVFIDNIISEFGVGNPDSIEDDVSDYVKNNVAPLYMGDIMDLYVRKVAVSNLNSSNNYTLVRGDLVTSDRYQLGYYNESDFKLTKVTNLIYTFEYNLDNNYEYSLLFNLGITKI